MEHQKRLTDLAMADLAATVAETGETGMGLVHEVAKFRGALVGTGSAEASRQDSASSTG